MPEPTEAPPSYDAVVGSSNTQPSKSTHLEVPKARNGIPASRRRSMEDELRKLPAGWIRQWDDKEHHQFFVDTKATPPRSIWHHPYDDDQYLSSLSSEERERIQEEESNLKKPNRQHMDTTDEEGDHHETAALPPRPTGSKEQKKGLSGLGRKMKDKVTGMTHEERQAERAQREEEERKYYEMHQKFRQAMATAQATGQPQFFAKDKDGKDIYVEPPQNYGARYNGPYGGGGAGYGYNPYQSGLYGNPNARFIRPQAPYGRPYGPGYGGGMGMPLMGGMMGGMLLGGLLF